LHVQVSPEQLQLPEHVPSAVLLAPPHPRGQMIPMAAANAAGANRLAVRIVTRPSLRHWIGETQRPIVQGMPPQQFAEVVHTWP